MLEILLKKIGRLTINDELLCLKDIALKYGFNNTTINYRYHKLGLRDDDLIIPLMRKR